MIGWGVHNTVPRMNIRAKILWASVSSISVLILAMLGLTAHRFLREGDREVARFREDALSRQIAAIREQVETGLSLLKPYVDSADSPELRARAREVVGRIRFGKSGYLFVYDYDGNCQVLTVKPEWMGTNRIGEKDKLDRPYVKLLVESGRRGGDTVRYSFDKPGTKVVADKIAYAKEFEPWKWTIGTGVYIDDIDSLVSARRAEVLHRTRSTIGAIFLLAVVLMAAIVAATVLALNKALAPLDVLQERMAEVASGEADLRRRIDIQSVDEVGKVSQSFNAFLGSLQVTVNQVGSASKTLAATSEELSAMSTAMAGESAKVAQGSREVSGTVGQAAGSLEQVSQSASTATSSVSTLAAAIEEMNCSLKEVAHTGQEELECSRRAKARSSEAKGAMARLDQVIDGVGEILESIELIADQTKLLALNATIEAARAGEAGKGFAVVAGEVKQLAQQTAAATSAIQQRIAQMREGGQEASKAFAEVESVIDEVHHMSQIVGSAVEEQSATINEIAKTVGVVDREVASIARTVNGAAGELASSSSNLREVNGGVGRLESGVGQIDQAIRELARLAAELHATAGRFRT